MLNIPWLTPVPLRAHGTADIYSESSIWNCPSVSSCMIIVKSFHASQTTALWISDIDSRFLRKAKLGPYFKVLGILKLENLVWLKIATFISQIRNKGNNIPHLFSELLLSVSNIHSHSTRYATQDNCYRIHARTNY